MGIKFYFGLCKRDFWNDFFSPRYPGVHIILLLVLLDTIYACASVLMSTYFDNFSHLQHVGYITIFMANMIVIVTGFLSIHFLTLKPENTRLSYCIFLHVAMIFAILLGVLTIVLMLTTPDSSEIKEHTGRYVKIYHRAPYMMRNVFKEKQCCGITKFGDVFKEVHPEHVRDDVVINATAADSTYFRIPPSCCRAAVFDKCEKWAKELLSRTEFNKFKDEYLNHEPCLKKGENFSKIKSTAAYAVYLQTVFASFGLFAFILSILGVLNYYIWYRFPRMPQDQRPDRFNEDLRSFMMCKYRTLKKSLAESKARSSADREAMLEGRKDAMKNVSEFAIRHQMIMQSLANMRTLNRELRQKEQQERQVTAAKSQSNMLMPKLSGKIPVEGQQNQPAPPTKQPTKFLEVPK